MHLRIRTIIYKLDNPPVPLKSQLTWPLLLDPNSLKLCVFKTVCGLGHVLLSTIGLGVIDVDVVVCFDCDCVKSQVSSQAQIMSNSFDMLL